MCTNIGHGHPHVIDAIKRQAETLAYANPFMATEPRARLGQKLAEICARRHRHVLLHQRRRRGERERHQARPHGDGPPQDPGALPQLPRRHRRGDDADRRSAPLGDRAGHPGRRPRHRPVPRHRSADSGQRGRGARQPRGDRSSSRDRTRSRPSSSRRSSAPTASWSRRTATSQGVREICDRYGILMIADEVMAGFGRTGKWFAVDHWDVVPDLHHDGQGPHERLRPARGGGHAAQVSPSTSTTNVFYGGLTYNSHPLACATALATIEVYEEDGPHRARRTHGRAAEASITSSWPRSTRAWARRAASACSASSSWFATARPWSRWRRSTARRDEMTALGKRFREEGLYTFVRWNTFFTNPPLTITRGGAGRGVRDHRSRPRDHRCRGRLRRPHRRP